ncbi:CPBP family intramembrane glutamic endopeptidase [Undibacterium sp. Di26W]|uniref:CPBP family intramembrane glutamic endopeptidase n=1 Tax=Undibacterium sp. Di26W TaxID=3413035 RepID=UPI003BF12D0B
MTTQDLNKSHPLAFFVLVFALSTPFWIISVNSVHSFLPDDIPVTDIGATLSPFIAACALIYMENGTAGLKRFLARILDYDRIKNKRWLVIAIFLLPCLYAVTYAAMRIAALPVPHYLTISTSLLGALAMFTVAATVEEIGYSAYATDALQSKHSALETSLIIGVPWALWHLPSMIKMSQTSQLIAWGLVATLAFRVITVWIYNNSNFSLFAVVIAHAVGTTTRTAFPGGRHGYELGEGSISYFIIILTAIIVTTLWGWRSLSNFRGSRSLDADN